MVPNEFHIGLGAVHCLWGLKHSNIVNYIQICEIYQTSFALPTKIPKQCGTVFRSDLDLRPGYLNARNE
jgi:hypothetical protein